MKIKEIREFISNLSEKDKAKFLIELKLWEEKNELEENCKGEMELKSVAKEVIDRLNKMTGKRYRYSRSSLVNIIARLKEYELVDLLKVIDIKSRDSFFIENPQFMNPQTLFRPSNFERYINEQY